MEEGIRWMAPHPAVRCTRPEPARMTKPEQKWTARVQAWQHAYRSRPSLLSARGSILTCADEHH